MPQQDVLALEAAPAPEVGLEPTTTRLTVACSTIELLRNRSLRGAETTGRGFYGKLFFRRRGFSKSQVILSAAKDPVNVVWTSGLRSTGFFTARLVPRLSVQNDM